MVKKIVLMLALMSSSVAVHAMNTSVDAAAMRAICKKLTAEEVAQIKAFIAACHEQGLSEEEAIMLCCNQLEASLEIEQPNKNRKYLKYALITTGTVLAIAGITYLVYKAMQQPKEHVHGLGCNHNHDHKDAHHDNDGAVNKHICTSCCTHDHEHTYEHTKEPVVLVTSLKPGDKGYVAEMVTGIVKTGNLLPVVPNTTNVPVVKTISKAAITTSSIVTTQLNPLDNSTVDELTSIEVVVGIDSKDLGQTLVSPNEMSQLKASGLNTLPSYLNDSSTIISSTIPVPTVTENVELTGLKQSDLSNTIDNSLNPLIISTELPVDTTTGANPILVVTEDKVKADDEH